MIKVEILDYTMNILGIVGGLGTETSCSFCLNINQAIKKSQGVQPQVIMENVPISDQALKRIAYGKFSAEVLGLLVDSVKRLNACRANLIVIPCNTVHVFITDLRRISDVPILSIIEETVKECQKMSYKKVGLLGSTTTINEGLYSTELQKYAIDVIVPDGEDQQFVSECILRIINQSATVEDKKRMIEIAEKMQSKGAEGLILGCTDLFLLISAQDVTILLVDSTTILEKAVVAYLLKSVEEI